MSDVPLFTWLTDHVGPSIGLAVIAAFLAWAGWKMSAGAVKDVFFAKEMSIWKRLGECVGGACLTVLIWGMAVVCIVSIPDVWANGMGYAGEPGGGWRMEEPIYSDGY